MTIYKEKVREMKKKQVIRINENQLKQIVMESVKKVLNEGKKVNNNPYFDEYYSGNGGPKGRKIKPGEKIYNGLNPDGSDSSSDWDLKGNHRQNGGLSNQEFMDIAKKIPEKDGYKSPYFQQLIDDMTKENELQQKMQKHNQRLNNYMYSGYHSEDDPRLHTLWGSKEQEDETHALQMKNRKKWAEMLKVNGISLKDYKSMSEKEQDDCWEYYKSWNSPRNRRARYWDEIGDPNWDNIYDNL